MSYCFLLFLFKLSLGVPNSIYHVQLSTITTIVNESFLQALRVAARRGGGGGAGARRRGAQRPGGARRHDARARLHDGGADRPPARAAGDRSLSDGLLNHYLISIA